MKDVEHFQIAITAFCALRVSEQKPLVSPSQSTRNQESTVWPDHRDSGRKDLVQDDPGRRGLEQNVRSPVWEHNDVSHIEEYQEYMLRGKECLRRLV